MWKSSREVTEDRGGSRGNGDYTERRVLMERRGFRAGGLQGGGFGEINSREAGEGWKAETGNNGDCREGQERASATTFWEPGRWRMLLVNSKMRIDASADVPTKTEKL